MRGAGCPGRRYEQLLLRCARAIGAGLRARREAQLARAAASVVKDIYPSHVVPQLLRHHSRQARSRGTGVLACVCCRAAPPLCTH